MDMRCRAANAGEIPVEPEEGQCGVAGDDQTVGPGYSISCMWCGKDCRLYNSANHNFTP